jgi:hypothetical protein
VQHTYGRYGVYYVVVVVVVAHIKVTMYIYLREVDGPPSV